MEGPGLSTASTLHRRDAPLCPYLLRQFSADSGVNPQSQTHRLRLRLAQPPELAWLSYASLQFCRLSPRNQINRSYFDEYSFTTAEVCSPSPGPLTPFAITTSRPRLRPARPRLSFFLQSFA
jgi:hypothetical protein